MFKPRSFLRGVSRFARNKAGNIGIVFALTITPILLSVTIAIDFTRAADEKAKLDAAVDAATLYAATLSANKSLKGVFDAQKTAAQKYFTAAVGPLREGTTVSPLTINVTVDPSNASAIVATGSYTASIDTLLGTLYKSQVPLSGSSSATIQMPSYIDFYLLLDHSPSMGLAASQKDIDKMVSLTPDKCEFACHVVDSSGKSDPNDYLSIATKNGVQLRIDMLRNAAQALTQTALNMQAKTGLINQFRMGVYGFNSNVTVFSATTTKKQTSYTQDNGMIADLAKVATSAASMQLTPYSSDNNYFLTDFVAVFNSMNKIVSNPGDGSTSSTPEKYVFFVTDGVQDLPLNNADGSKDPKYTQYDNTWGWGHAIAPIDPTICSAIKNRGVKIAVLYTPFLATSAGASPLSDHDIALWKDDIPVKLKSCATSGLFYTADSQGIGAAMNQMFQDALRQARLTQ